jgi:hypothetical protein
MAIKSKDNKIENKNYLAPTGFRFILNKSPKVSFMGNMVNIPSLNLGIAEYSTRLRPLPEPGSKVTFGDLELTFLVDEDLENYMEIQNWIRGLGSPFSLHEIQELYRSDIYEQYQRGVQSNIPLFSDGVLTVLNSNNRANFKINFYDLFPYNLSALDFDATQTDVQYFTARVEFKYTIYTITDMTGNPL